MEKKYIFIKQDLLNKINAGEYQINKAIPSERDLAQYYSANRMTVRKAIEELMYEGILIRKKGSGTFLTDTKAGRDVWMSSLERKAETVKIVSCKMGEESNYGYRALRIEHGTPYWRMRRVRSFDGTPYAYEDIYFSRTFFPGILKEDYQLGLRKLIARYEPNHDVMVYEEVEALLCLHNTACLLKVKVNSPILQIKSYFERNGEIIMHCRSYHPGDIYKYQGEKTVL